MYQLFVGLLMLGLLVVNKFVDAVVQPETVMQAMRQGYLVPEAPKAGRGRNTDSDPKPANGESAGSDGKARVIFERQGADRLVIYAEELKQQDRAAQQKEEKLGFVFERSGFATWRLTAVTLPLGSR